VAPRGRDDRCFPCLDADLAFPAREKRAAVAASFHAILGDLSRRPTRWNARFLEFKTRLRLNDEFHAQLPEIMPLAGLGRHPGAVMPAMPFRSEIQGNSWRESEFHVEDYIATMLLFLVQATGAPSANCSRGWGACRLHTGSPDRKTKPPDFQDPGTASESRSCFKSSCKGAWPREGAPCETGF